MDSWQIWIDTGGTFTDCLALDPDENLHRRKVLSSSALRGSVIEWLDRRSLTVEERWGAPADFISGFTFRLLGENHPPVEVAAFDPGRSQIRLSDEWMGPIDSGRSFEVQSEWEAPITAARLITGTGSGQTLPPVELRLATTKGTNALLERSGTPPDLFITEGFTDLLAIGDQKRPELFALEIKKPRPLYRNVVAVPERIDAEGDRIRALDADRLAGALPEQKADSRVRGSAAVCLMNAYRNPKHEEQVAALLEEAGYSHISVSSNLNPFVKIIPRARTTVVNAYLSPVLANYLESVDAEIAEGSLRVMTSAGGLVTANRFNAKDSLLSGPAGGVVGASAVGKECGFERMISFDMGGTSTDVSRYDGGFDYLFEHTVGDARLAAPALSIETVAAGGGSICGFDGFKLTVGPESAG
ncbi:MAG: hydantoinase/oxoprolinase family protein, partial [Balneolaceae bacterium]|nr:hydantoinase/oxoprolinase family protein [Balneolaceae bacterium]